MRKTTKIIIAIILIPLLFFTILIVFSEKPIMYYLSSRYRNEYLENKEKERSEAAAYTAWVSKILENPLYRFVVKYEEGEPIEIPNDTEKSIIYEPDKYIFQLARLWQDDRGQIISSDDLIFANYDKQVYFLDFGSIDIFSTDADPVFDHISMDDQDLLVKQGLALVAVKLEHESVKRSSTKAEPSGIERAYEEAIINSVLKLSYKSVKIYNVDHEKYIPYRPPIPTAIELILGKQNAKKIYLKIIEESKTGLSDEELKNSLRLQKNEASVNAMLEAMGNLK